MWVNDPNPLHTPADLVSAMAVSLLLEGEAYLFPLRDRSGRVSSVGVANPRAVDHHYEGGDLAWYVNGQRTTMEFLHLRDLTLPGRIAGARRVDAIRPLSNISGGSLNYTQQHLDRGGAYQLVISFDPKSRSRTAGSKDEMEMVKRMLENYHAGWENAYNPLVLPPDLQVQPLDPKMLNADGGFLDLKQTTDAQIAVSFGIDPLEVGVAVPNMGASRTYTNEPARLLKFYRDALEPVKTVIEDGLTRLLPTGQKMRLAEKDWLLGGPHDRALMVQTMALVNKHHGAPVFSVEELREMAGVPGPPPPAPPATTGDGEDLQPAPRVV